MQYELINPSDPYTFIAKNKEVAALVVFSLNTMYGAKSEDAKEEIPIFLFGGEEEWYQKEFNRSIKDGFSAEKEEVSKALLSFMLGDFKDRRRYELALNSITDDDKRAAFIQAWQDDRSSLNDIGTVAHERGKMLNDAE